LVLKEKVKKSLYNIIIKLESKWLFLVHTNTIKEIVLNGPTSRPNHAASPPSPLPPLTHVDLLGVWDLKKIFTQL
jgi:hypothetical protein